MNYDVGSLFSDIPFFTKSYIFASISTTALCKLNYLSPLKLYFHIERIKDGQLWRLITSFFFFGSKLDLNLIFQLFFFCRYSSSLEEEFIGRSSDFVYMLFVGWTMILLLGSFFSVIFLGSAFSFMLAYIWCRRNHDTRMNLMGLFNFPASYLPFLKFFAYLILKAHNIFL
ncbi:Derlin-2 [Bonamia ostreae]|uniref:Derlin n=1 Tax=Bonamia ostreae TaxID=126728 RepID=A0ABV2APE0_9EUKA